MDLSEKKSKLEAISIEIEKCGKCRLCEQATNAVPGDGNPDAEIAFIGEAPGFYEDQQGLPFVGRAGKLLEFMLGQIGLDRKDAWIGNIIKHRPPDNRDPLPDEIAACQPYLTGQLEILSPKLIVTLGRFAMNYFVPSAKISRDHGRVFELSNYLVYPIYHPAAGLRNPKLKAETIKDFLKIPEILKGNYLEPEKVIIKNETKKHGQEQDKLL